MLSTASVSTHYTGEAALSGETNDGEADLDCDDGELEKEEENDEEENDEKEDDEENDEEDDRDEWDLNRAALLPCKAKLKMLGSLPFDFRISSRANFALKELDKNFSFNINTRIREAPFWNVLFPYGHCP